MREPRRPSTAPWSQTPNGIGNKRSWTARTAPTENTIATAVDARPGNRRWVVSDSCPSRGHASYRRANVPPRVAPWPHRPLLVAAQGTGPPRARQGYDARAAFGRCPIGGASGARASLREIPEFFLVRSGWDQGHAGFTSGSGVATLAPWSRPSI